MAPLTIQQAVAEGATTATGVIAIVTNLSFHPNNRAHVLIMDESCAPRNARITLYGNDCKGIANSVQSGDVVRFNELCLVSSSTRDLDVQHNFKRASICETDQPTWERMSEKGCCMVTDRVNDEEVNSSRVKELLLWYNQRKNLPVQSLPCRRRRLHEIQAVGLISHVQVRVIAVEAASVRHQRTKIRKCLMPTASIATLLDDDGDVASLVDCQGFQVALINALKARQRVQISSVRSIQPDEGDSSVLLAPTYFTTIVNCPSEKKWKARIIQTQEFSTLHSPPVIRTFSATVESIWIPDLNTYLERKHFLSPNAFAAILVNQETLTFRSVMLTLKETRVWASSDVVKLVCGSVEAKDVLLHFTTRRNVLELIQGLLEEDIELLWTVEKNAGEEYHVTNVLMKKL